MKTLKLFVLGLALILQSFAFAQVEEAILSEAEEFGSQSGTLIQKEFIYMDKIKTIEVNVLNYKNLNSGEIKSCLHFQMPHPVVGRSNVAALDLDELEALSKSLTYMLDNAFKSNPTFYTEVIFRSRTGIEIGGYTEFGRDKWVTFIKLNPYDKYSRVDLKPLDFEQLFAIIQDAIPLMKG